VAVDTGAHGDMSWQDDALCAETDPEIFHPHEGGSTRDAKRVCGACDVRQQCLDYAIANRIPDGVWGGLSPLERKARRAA